MMNQKIKMLLGDVERITTVVSSAEERLAQLHVSRPEGAKLVSIREELAEVHTRLEGVREFVLACQSKANRKTAEQEDIDVWL